jgi:hypothetical protein
MTLGSESERRKVAARLRELTGTRCVHLHFAANMLVLHFAPSAADSRPPDRWHLHVQCPWRIERSGRIESGILNAIDDDVDAVRRLQERLRMEVGSGTVVLKSTVDRHFGFRLDPDGMRIEAFACASPEGRFHESWRLWGPPPRDDHFVVGSSGIELEDGTDGGSSVAQPEVG